MADNRTPQPLVDNQPIVNERGLPTQYFIRWAQERQIAIEDGISAAQAEQLIIDYLAAHALQEGTGISITPTGNISDDPTIALDAVLDDLNDVDFSTPPTDGQVIGFDGASEKWVPVDQSGGGGGGDFRLWAPSAGNLDNIAAPVVTVTGSHSGTPQNSFRWAPNNDWYWNNGEAAGTVKFDFGTKVVLSGIGFLQDNATVQGTWQAAGSNDDAFYTNLGAPAVWGGDKQSSIPFDNSTAYRYYKLTQTAGATSSSPYQQLFLFRWGAKSTPPPPAPTATIRATNGGYYNDNHIDIVWPAGTVVGDVVCVINANGYFVGAPAGWTELLNASSSVNRVVVAFKVMDAADITAGGVTFNNSGSFDGAWVTIGFVGAPTLTVTNNFPGGNATINVTTAGDTVRSDTLINYGSCREGGARVITINSGTSAVAVAHSGYSVAVTEGQPDAGGVNTVGFDFAGTTGGGSAALIVRAR